MPIKVKPFINPFRAIVKKTEEDKVVIYNGKEYKQVSKKR